jgi:hypothetical protein
MSDHRTTAGSDARDVYDLLRKTHLAFLGGEHDAFREIREPYWHLRRAPYPLDAETAAAVRWIVDGFVAPWELVGMAVEGWVYPQFRADAVECATRFDRMPPAAAERSIPDLETLRAWESGDVPDRLVGIWGEEFISAREAHEGVIRAHVAATPDLAGTFVEIPYMPLGESRLGRVPLVGGEWVDRRVVALWEACASLHARGWTRLPALDPHPIAWHRVFPPGTRWADPRAAGQDQLDGAIRRAEEALRSFRGGAREIGGRQYLRFADYCDWRGRQVPGDLRRARREGVAVGRWNAWVLGHAPDGLLDLCGEDVGLLGHPCPFREGEDYLGGDDRDRVAGALGERAEVLARLTEVAARIQASPRRTGAQLQILRALAAGPKTADKLAAALRCDRRTLWKPGWLPELLDRGEVVKYGRAGYHLPTQLPPPG